MLSMNYANNGLPYIIEDVRYLMVHDDTIMVINTIEVSSLPTHIRTLSTYCIICTQLI